MESPVAMESPVVELQPATTRTSTTPLRTVRTTANLRRDSLLKNLVRTNRTGSSDPVRTGSAPRPRHRPWGLLALGARFEPG